MVRAGKAIVTMDVDVGPFGKKLLAVFGLIDKVLTVGDDPKARAELRACAEKLLATFDDELAKGVGGLT